MWASGKKAAASSGFDSKVSVTLSGAQSIPNVSFTIIEFDTEVYDTLGEFNTTTHKFIPQETGWYHIHISGDTQLGGGTQEFQIHVRVDGSDAIVGMEPTAADIYTIGSAGKDLYLTAGQEVTGIAYQSSGVAKTLRAEDWSTFLTIHRFA